MNSRRPLYDQIGACYDGTRRAGPGIVARLAELLDVPPDAACLDAACCAGNDTAAVTAAVPGLHDRLLSERLRELTAEHLVDRHVYREMPVRIEYALTRKGCCLKRATWNVRWRAIAFVDVRSVLAEGVGFEPTDPG